MIVILTKKATEDEIKRAKEEFANYIKVVADIENKIAAVGGGFHAGAEKLLIENGSMQKTSGVGDSTPSPKSSIHKR